ncbi:hypothetical protein FQA39_LY17902 [Lamprigera yunnana]|nr:hypothetical protein FQA39_LY17902 [Lamprigera yunnana]
MLQKLQVVFFLFCLRLATARYHVKLSSDSPTVRGATVHFAAEVFDDDEPASGQFKYIWEDNCIISHSATHISESNVDYWSVTYPANSTFPPGPYEVQLTVEKSFIGFFYVRRTSQRLTFELTEHLNGKLIISQLDQVKTGKYISNATPVVHKVILTKSDQEYVNRTATRVQTYWFVDCIYYGTTTDYTFTFTYSDVNKRHKVEALTVVSYDPITTPAPPTTTTTTTTLSPNVTTVAPLPTTTSAPNVTAATTTATSKKVKRSALNDTGPTNTTQYPFVCSGNGTVPPDPKKTYGVFTRKFVSKAPVSNITISGNYWIPKGAVLDLKVKCQGSSEFSYCKHVFEGVYNVTGNETCDVPPPDTSDQCEFPIKRYFSRSAKYTIVLVIYNDVAKMVSPVTVTIYEVAHQAQLSVIVVPVASSLVAIVLIIFGVAYYVQNRSRFIVEVADFNFGQQCTDLEYKTFQERLCDSITNAFLRAPTPSSSEPTIWPPGRKYGSLT